MAVRRRAKSYLALCPWSAIFPPIYSLALKVIWRNSVPAVWSAQILQSSWDFTEAISIVRTALGGVSTCGLNSALSSKYRWLGEAILRSMQMAIVYMNENQSFEMISLRLILRAFHVGCMRAYYFFAKAISLELALEFGDAHFDKGPVQCKKYTLNAAIYLTVSSISVKWTHWSLHKSPVLVLSWRSTMESPQLADTLILENGIDSQTF